MADTLMGLALVILTLVCAVGGGWCVVQGMPSARSHWHAALFGVAALLLLAVGGAALSFAASLLL